MLRATAFLALVLLAFSIAGCNGDESGSGGSADTPKSGELPKLELKDDTPNLLLTWVDEKGDFHVVQKVGDVPEGSREQVRTVVTTREEGTGRLVYVADLRKKGPDGAYPVKTMTRAAWDDIGATRRKARLEALAPSARPSAAPSPRGPDPAGDTKVRAIIYSAEWCKPCHDAARYLKKKGVVVTKKDIEKSDIARKEMQQKLAKAGRAGAQIPVIDVMGQLLVGFSPRALDRAVVAARNAKAL